MQQIIALLIKYLVVPLFSSLVAWIIQKGQDKLEESKRNSEIDDALKKFKEASTSKEKEDAFKALIRSRRS